MFSSGVLESTCTRLGGEGVQFRGPRVCHYYLHKVGGSGGCCKIKVERGDPPMGKEQVRG